MAKVVSSSSNIGGRSGSATSGGYNQGAAFAASTGGSKPGSQDDLRGRMPSSGGYAQAPTVVATTGGDKPGSHKDLRGGNAKSK